MLRLGSAVVYEGVTVLFSAPTFLDDDVHVDEAPNKTVVVSGFNDGAKETLIRMYFENVKKSGGGPIQEIQMHPDKKQAVVTFKDEAGLSNSSTTCVCLVHSCTIVSADKMGRRAKWRPR